MDGPDDRIIPGNALAVSHDMPYRGLERFGVSFLNRFEGSQLPSPVLRYITLIDTPGVLSGEKQRLARGYDFTQVTAWFASRADLIILLFDAHKLDISDEFKSVIDSFKGNEEPSARTALLKQLTIGNVVVHTSFPVVDLKCWCGMCILSGFIGFERILCT